LVTSCVPTITSIAPASAAAMNCAAFLGRIARVRGDDRQPRLGQQLLDLVRDPLDPGSAGDEALGLAALGQVSGGGVS
jgi:hypothetical protein